MNLHGVDWESLSIEVAYFSFYVICVVLFFLLLALMIRPAVTPLEKGVLSKTLAFNMVIWRVIALRFSGDRTLGMPLEMFWWVTVAILLLHFGWTLATDYYGPVFWPRIRSLGSRLRRFVMRMRMVVALVVLCLLGGIAVAKAQEGPILLDQGTTENDVPGPVVTFGDTEIMAEPAKGPVQGIISQRREYIEAGEVYTDISGIVAISGPDDWYAAETEFVFRKVTGEWVGAELLDGFHVELDAE